MQRVNEFYKLIHTTPWHAVEFAQFVGCSPPSCNYYWFLLHKAILPPWVENLKIYSTIPMRACEFDIRANVEAIRAPVIAVRRVTEYDSRTR